VPSSQSYTHTNEPVPQNPPANESVPQNHDHDIEIGVAPEFEGLGEGTDCGGMDASVEDVEQAHVHDNDAMFRKLAEENRWTQATINQVLKVGREGLNLSEVCTNKRFTCMRFPCRCNVQ
jgi:hypothetical protein